LTPGRLKLRGEGTSGWYEEDPRKIAYDGPNMSFMISPEILNEIIKKGAKCTISPGLLQVSGDKWIYAASLFIRKVEEE
jgi:hypothetical protein